jgi:hypothetical protein
MISRVLLVAIFITVRSPAEEIWPSETWHHVAFSEVGMDAAKLEQARSFAETGGGSGYITRHGKLVVHWGDASKLFDLKLEFPQESGHGPDRSLC